MELHAPECVNRTLETLRGAGYEAYLVGGCVRDSLLRLPVHDWDVATSALPEEVERLFAPYPLSLAGEKHGTVSVQYPGCPVEITTFRVDGGYADHRRPDSVRFSQSLREDLARRDFTINAMAYDGELIDYFGGQEDLGRRSIRCVGKPRRRFEEDSLRILRALRFASVLSFTLEKRTYDAVMQCRGLLAKVSPERTAQEFLRLLCGRNAVRVLRQYRRVFEVFLPELAPMAGLSQRSPYHRYDVWEHTLHAVGFAPRDPELRLAVLLHDIGKPQCKTIDKSGRGHFHGHQEAGALIAGRVCERLHLSRSATQDITALVRWHDVSCVCGEANVRRWLNRLGPRLYRRLLKLNRADTLAHAPAAFKRLSILDQAERDLERILREKQCWALDRLAVKGDDLLAYAQGPALGELLRRLLDAVIDGTCPNERETLLALAARLAEGGED